MISPVAWQGNQQTERERVGLMRVVGRSTVEGVVPAIKKVGARARGLPVNHLCSNTYFWKLFRCLHDTAYLVCDMTIIIDIEEKPRLTEICKFSKLSTN